MCSNICLSKHFQSVFQRFTAFSKAQKGRFCTRIKDFPKDFHFEHLKVFGKREWKDLEDRKWILSSESFSFWNGKKLLRQAFQDQFFRWEGLAESRSLSFSCGGKEGDIVEWLWRRNIWMAVKEKYLNYCEGEIFELLWRRRVKCLNCVLEEDGENGWI